MKKLLSLLMLAGLITSLIYAIDIAPGGSVSQDFTIGTSATATLPSDWKADKNTTVRSVGSYSAAATATEQRAGNSMSSTAANGIYNYAAGDATTALDRAVGGISSSSAAKSVNLYVMLTNNGTTQIPSFTISYGVEKYRKGSNAAGFSIQMYYSTNGTSWTSAGSDFLTSFSADADNTGYASAPGATSSVSSKTLSVSVAPSSSLYLAWNYSVTSGTTTSNAQALGVDDVSIVAGLSGTPTISVTGTLTAFSTVSGTASAYQSYKLSGSNLEDDISVTAPTNFEICKTFGGTYTSGLTYAQSGGSVAEQDVFVRIAASAAVGTVSGNVSHSSTTAAVNQAVSGTVYKTEPTNHVTSFSVATGTPSYSVIVATWTDATGTVVPDGYLIKGSAESYEEITDPSDYSAEANAELVKNVAASVQTASFTGLDGNTTYFFKIFPYSNSGANIDYKIGASPSDDAQTTAAPSLLAYWNFNTNPPVSPNNWTAPIAASSGTGNLTYTFTAATSFVGSTLNGIENESEGGSFVPSGGASLINNGAYFDLNVPTSGYQSIAFSYATRGTAQGFTTQSISYSINGTDFSPLTSFSGMNTTSWSVQSVDFSSISGVNNNPNFKVRIVLTGAAAEAGNNRFDNISIYGDEEGNTPVELSSFTAVLSATNYVNLNWVTQTETGVQGYYIYRAASSQLVDAEMVSPMIAATNTSQQQSYVFTDNNLYEAGTYYYWLQNVDFDGNNAFHGPVSVYYSSEGNNPTPEIPLVTQLNSIYPNPFNPTTFIPFSIATSADVSFKIYNSRGQIVKHYDLGTKAPGNYRIEWNGSDYNGQPLANGVYYVKMLVGRDSYQAKAVLLK